jgi:hypothetical protein
MFTEILNENYKWIVTGVLIPTLLTLLKIRSGRWKESVAKEKLELKQIEFRSRNNNRLFWQAIVLILGFFFYISWLFSRDKKLDSIN